MVMQTCLAKADCWHSKKHFQKSRFQLKKASFMHSVQGEMKDIVSNASIILEARLSGIVEQLDELRGLRGKN